METDLTDEEIQELRDKSKRSVSEQRRNSLLPLQWRITHSSRWLAQVIAAEFSLVAFFLLLVMVFSKKWLYPSRSRFHQRYPDNVTHRIYASIHSMSIGLLDVCLSRSCSSSNSEKDSFKPWTQHPLLGVAKMIFALSLVVGLALTSWLHLPYVPRLQKMYAFGLIGIILNFCEVVFISFILLLFPLNVWIFELKRNVSVPIGWSYFLGWLAFILYVICGILCYLNHKSFWSLILHSNSNITISSDNTTWSRESLRGHMSSRTTLETPEETLVSEQKSDEKSSESVQSPQYLSPVQAFLG